MYKKFMVPSVVPQGSDYKPSVMEVEIPDEWSKLEVNEQDAFTDLMTHYLQKRWDEQYKKLVNNEQKTIMVTLLKLRALEDIKKEINYKLFNNNLGTLSKYILQAHAKLKEKQGKERGQCEKINPSILDEVPAKEPQRLSQKM